MTPEIVLVTSDDELIAPVRLACSPLGYALSAPLQAGASLEDLASAAAIRRPAAILLDLDLPATSEESTDWRTLASAVKRAAATRRVPVLGLTRRVAAMQAEARRFGCDDVIDRERGALEPQLKAALRRWVRQIDPEALADACKLPLHPDASRGIELFNHGEYFEAHELLEAAWNEDPGPARDLYQGLLQIAVAYLQIERGNHAGATKLFLRMWHWLDALPATCRGVDVADARSNARTAQQALAALTPDHIDSFDRSLFRPIRMIADSER